MQVFHRNQLVWLTNSGWLEAKGHDWDDQASCILHYWSKSQLPLVICTQRISGATDSFSLGLPAPQIWGRRKLGIQLHSSMFDYLGQFPPLDIINKQLLNDEISGPLLEVKRLLNVEIAVHGSYGWQVITNMEYLRPQSDLDIQIAVSDQQVAIETVNLLHQLRLPIRIDGELIFPSGNAVAWREYKQWSSGQTDTVLVKNKLGVRLIDGSKLVDPAGLES